MFVVKFVWQVFWCGASVVVYGRYYELFERFCTFQGVRQSVDLVALNVRKNISYYGTFLRVVLMKWFKENNIYIFILLVRT